MIRRINLALVSHFNSHQLHCPNTTTVFPWEADLVSVTRSNLIHEFEIKISKSDFRADFKKVKHRLLKEKWENDRSYSITKEELERIWANWKPEAKDALTLLHYHEIKQIPNYFWFVCYGFDVTLVEIPEYAGYIKIENSGEYIFVNRIKEAPIIHRHKLEDKQREHLYGSINARYWKWAAINETPPPDAGGDGE